MSVTFTKLFSSITASTVWCEPDRTRIVWIAMLAMADRKGRVWASIPGLASIARVPVEDCRTAIESFLSPDRDSRTKDNEGKRIEEIDGGWLLLNYEKYRERQDAETIKESKRRYINARRARERQGITIRANKVDIVSHESVDKTIYSSHQSRQAEADAEAVQQSTLQPDPLP
jgi:hypothetical protein